jgi:hypothetical protein
LIRLLPSKSTPAELVKTRLVMPFCWHALTTLTVPRTLTRSKSSFCPPDAIGEAVWMTTSGLSLPKSATRAASSVMSPWWKAAALDVAASAAGGRTSTMSTFFSPRATRARTMAEPRKPAPPSTT